MFPIRDNIPSKSFPIVMLLIILVNVAVFSYQLTLSPIAADIFIKTYGLTPANVNFLEPQTLLSFMTSMFIHGGWLHIISNMWFLWVFGDNVESRYGHFNFLLFYLAAGIIASLFQYFIGPASTIPSIGASGAIAGVLGSYLIFYPQAKILTVVFIFIFITAVEISAPIVLGVWFALQVLSGIFATNNSLLTGGSLVAYWVHVAGFIFGIGMALANKLLSPKY